MAATLHASLEAAPIEFCVNTLLILCSCYPGYYDAITSSRSLPALSVEYIIGLKQYWFYLVALTSSPVFIRASQGNGAQVVNKLPWSLMEERYAR